ncbi:MAG: alpha-2-macroglobulin family protein [Thermoplasmata archaeon]
MRRIPARQLATSKSLAKALAIALLLTAATGLAVYNLDSAYVASKSNLVAYVPDRLPAGGETALIIMTMSNDAEPVPGQKVTVTLKTESGSRLVWSGKTDTSGMATPVIEVPSECKKVKVVVRAENEEVAVDAVIDDTVRIIITTDKPVYQPGQTVHMRVLTFAGEAPLPLGTPITVDLVDPNGDKVFKKQLQPNEYGIAWYDLALSDQMIQGNYTIHAQVGQRTASKEILVKEYVLPKFKIGLLGLNEWYYPNSEIVGTVDVEYFFGRPVEGTVHMEARAYYGVWTEYWNASGRLIDGTYSFRIPPVGYVIGIREAGGNGYVQLNVTVTDTGGHTESRSKIIPIAARRVTLSVLTDACVLGAESTFYVIARAPDGTPTTRYPIEARFFDEQGVVGEPVRIVTDSRGVAELRFLYSGQKWLKLWADVYGAYYPTVVELGDGTGVKVLSDKTAYSVGDVARFTLAYNGESFTNSVYYDIVSRGYVVSRGVLELRDGRAQMDVTITPEMKPFAQMRVYKIEKDMTVSRDAVTFTVGSAAELSINITADSETYGPRDLVGINFDVTRVGEPVIAALGVSIADEAVYELGTQFQGFEALIFGLDEEFIKPQYQILSYVYGGSPSLPSESYSVIDELDKARMTSTWEQNIRDAAQLKADAVKMYWLAVLMVGSTGVLAATAYRARRGGGAMAVVLTVGVAAMIGISSALIHVMVLGYGGTSEPMMPRTPNIEDAPYYKFQAAERPGLGFDFEDKLFGDDSSATLGPETSFDVGQKYRTIVRNYFPETWYWNPFLLTDDSGHAEITLTAPDSITSWKVDVVASTKDGLVGSGNASITVFQPFFIDPDIPVSVVRNDIFDLKVQVYNYQDTSQNVTVTAIEEPWFELLSSASNSVIVPANYVSFVNFTIRASMVGWHTLTFVAESPLASDAIEKPIKVVPDGKPIKTLFNGQVENSTVTRTLVLDPTAIEGSESAWVKLQGGVEAVLLEGVEAFIQFVTGCGEQSLSLLSIDILAYDTVRSQGTSAEKLFEYESIVNQGIMHELMYLVETNNGIGRGIVWFPGDIDAHPWLTSWALIAFQDAINAGFGLDEDIISDMQDWLISIQNEDGSWEFPDWGIYEFNNPLLKSKKIAATAYIARALLRSGISPADDSIRNAVAYIETNVKGVWNDPFSLALSEIVLQAGGGSTTLSSEIARQLDSLKKEFNGTCYWSSGANLISDSGQGGAMVLDMWGGYSSARVIETTGYAIMALHGESGYYATEKGGVKYLLDHRSELGGWYSTQDTIVAFHALKEVGGPSSIKHVTATVAVEGVEVFAIEMDDFNKDVTYYVDLRPFLANVTNVSVSCAGEGAILYSIFLQQYVPWPDEPESSPFLTLTVTYDATSIRLTDTVMAHMHLLYSGDAPLIKMLLVDLRAPMGLAFNLSEFDQFRAQGVISSYDTNPRQVLIYLTDVRAGVPVDLDYTLVPTMPIKATCQNISAWDMYDPNGLRSEVLPVVFEVT